MSGHINAGATMDMTGMEMYQKLENTSYNHGDECVELKHT